MQWWFWCRPVSVVGTRLARPLPPAVSALCYVPRQMRCAVGFMIVACRDRPAVGCLVQFCREIFDDCMSWWPCRLRTTPATRPAPWAGACVPELRNGSSVLHSVLGQGWDGRTDGRIEGLLGEPETRRISAGTGHLQLGARGGLRLLARDFLRWKNLGIPGIPHPDRLKSPRIVLPEDMPSWRRNCRRSPEGKSLRPHRVWAAKREKLFYSPLPRACLLNCCPK